MLLYYAARVGQSQGVRQQGDAGADLQASSSGLNGIPLHEAAHNSALEAVKTLLALNAPSRPQDRSNRTLADLAREANNRDRVEVLDAACDSHDSHSSSSSSSSKRAAVARQQLP